MTNRQKLQKTLDLIKQFLIKEKRKYWITPKDKRYSRIVNKYKSRLSSLWTKTRDSYLHKFTSKQITELDDNPEQYDKPQFDSSEYIDAALLILAEAFGEAVIIGFKEIQNRGISIKIPENLHKLFNSAKEIKNYEWAALSYEQKQMDDIFNEYNKTTNGKEEIQKWFDNNEYRLTDLIIGGLVWYGIQYGFAQAIIEAQSGAPGSKILAFWITEQDNKVCSDCSNLEKNSPYSEENPLPTLPGGGKTICGSKCRCIIDYKQE